MCVSLCSAGRALAVAPGACGSVLISGSSWLDGGGVNVYSNGADEGTGVSCGGGINYQCVELVNRLYKTKGWISSYWYGNGGRSSPSARDSLWDEAPGNLSKQANGGISYVGPGDEVSINIYDGGTFIEDGHTLIVNNSSSISSGTVYLVSENSGSPSSANPQITATLSNGTLTIPNSGAWSYPVIGVVHAPTGGGGTPPEGSFVSNSGYVYRIAGGAPIYVSNWAAVGGAQPTTPLTNAELAALPQYPRNGTVLDSSSVGVFVVAGGAPLYVSNWAAIGGPKAGIGTDQASIENAGGGVPWNHLRRYPANGTLLGASNGGVFVVAGGAPLYVSNWAAIGGAQPTVAMDSWDIENISNPWAHLRPYPENGTLLAASGGGVFEIAGGAPMFVSSWSAIGGERPYVRVDEWDIENISNPWAHLRPYPEDGTFVNTSTGHVYRVAGGAPFAVSSWSVFGGEQPFVTIDEWDLEHIGTPAAHLNVSPVNGTRVEGIPSNTFWVFSGGVRRHSTSSEAATVVDDFGVAAFERAAPLAAAAGSTSLSPASESLSGSVDPDGEPVSECLFEYGPTMSYGSTVSCGVALGEGEAAVPVSVMVGGLKPNTEYHYRLVAVGPGGTSDGADGTFTTAAQVAPEVGRCVKTAGETEGAKTVYHGAFASSSCTKVSSTHTGEYEWETGALESGLKLGLASGSVALETTTKVKLSCTGASGTGSYSDLVTKVAGVELHLTGCEQAGVKCSTPGAGEGEVVSKTLEGTIGWVSKAKKKLALELSPDGNTGPLLEYACGPDDRTVTGAVLVPITTGKMLATTALKFKASKGKQKPETLEGAEKAILDSSVNGATPEQAGLTVNLTLTNEEPLETNTTI